MKTLLMYIPIFFFTKVLWATGPNKVNPGNSRTYSDAELKTLHRPNAHQICQGSVSAVSLYDPGKSLHQVKQQDQDGLGTCYANTASLMIKSYHPDKPVPSYLDLARFNPVVTNKNYEFDSGYACTVINQWQSKKRPLCTDSLLENQPSEVQDKILYGLYDAINKHQASPGKIKEIFEQYHTYLAQNPKPQRRLCTEKIEKLRFENYVELKILQLVDEQGFLPVRDDFNYTAEETNLAQACAKKFSERFKALGIIKEETYSMGDGTSSSYPILDPSQADRANELVGDFLKGQSLPSGETYLQRMVKILDAYPNYASRSNIIFNDNADAKSYQKFVNDLIKGGMDKILSTFMADAVEGRPELESCLSQSPAWRETNSEALMTSLLNQCNRGEAQDWYIDMLNKKDECPQLERSLFDVFNTLSDLELSMDEIEKFVLAEDKQLLKQIIEKNCNNWQDYPMPPGSCEQEPIPAGLATLERPEDWKIYQQFRKDLDGYCERFKLKNFINLKRYADFIVPMLDAMESDKNAELNIEQIKNYRDFLNNLVRGKDAQLLSYYPLANLRQEGIKAVTVLQQQQKSYGEEVVKSISEGHAVGLNTCSSLFYDDVKQKYSGCSNHAVTATGFKCQDGRLKLEVSNSWGIACADSPEQKNLFECQHDQDGLTNGRSWVDYDYLSDQGLEISRFKSKP